MGLLSKILFFPISGPVAGIRWSLNKVQQVAETELTDDSAVKQDLMELQMRLELGEIDDDEYAARERVLMERLRDVRYWREQLGMGGSSGPVRVARGDQGGA
ncbi:MAG: gas vesicle protein GvpG [Gemmatimonadaceae bacterium]